MNGVSLVRIDQIYQEHQYVALHMVIGSCGIARPGPRVADALHALAPDGPPAWVLICGLVPARDVLKPDGWRAHATGSAP